MDGFTINLFQLLPQPRAIAVNRNLKGQSGLWAYGISGDYPIISIDLYSHSQLNLAENMLKALKYWFVMGLKADLVLSVVRLTVTTGPILKSLTS